jgi:hypothetical protein
MVSTQTLQQQKSIQKEPYGCQMALTNIIQKKMMQYFPEIQVFVCCYEVIFFGTAVQFFC